MRKKFNKIIQKDLFDILKYSPNLNFLRNKSFMITGGSGMLLTYLILFFSYLNFYHKKNIKVYLLSTNILRDKKKLTIYGKLKNIFFLKINRSYLLKNNLKIDYVIHGAGYGDPKLFEKKKNQAINNGITSTIKLLAYSKKKKLKNSYILAVELFTVKMEKIKLLMKILTKINILIYLLTYMGMLSIFLKIIVDNILSKRIF